MPFGGLDLLAVLNFFHSPCGFFSIFTIVILHENQPLKASLCDAFFFKCDAVEDMPMYIHLCMYVCMGFEYKFDPS